MRKKWNKDAVRHLRNYDLVLVVDENVKWSNYKIGESIGSADTVRSATVVTNVCKPARPVIRLSLLLKRVPGEKSTAIMTSSDKTVEFEQIGSNKELKSPRNFYEVSREISLENAKPPCNGFLTNCLVLGT